MTLANAEVPFRVITPDDVRASIKRARRSLDKAADEIVWQIEMEAWRTLGYSSWTAMREAEYGGAAFMVPPKSRPELVARIEAAGQSKREAARTAGVDESTVRADLRALGAGNPAPPVEDVEDIVDAELVEDDAPATSEPTQNAETGPVAADPAPIHVTCPTCGGTGKVTQ